MVGVLGGGLLLFGCANLPTRIDLSPYAAKKSPGKVQSVDATTITLSTAAYRVAESVSVLDGTVTVHVLLTNLSSEPLSFGPDDVAFLVRGKPLVRLNAGDLSQSYAKEGTKTADIGANSATDQANQRRANFYLNLSHTVDTDSLKACLQPTCSIAPGKSDEGSVYFLSTGQWPAIVRVKLKDQYLEAKFTMPIPEPDSPSFPSASPAEDPFAVHAGIPVPTSDGTMAIPVMNGEVGVPVPTTDGSLAIPVAPN
jgi:hypothetical protein